MQNWLLPLQQKLEMSSFGCKSQKVRLKSIIFDLEINITSFIRKIWYIKQKKGFFNRRMKLALLPIFFLTIRLVSNLASFQILIIFPYSTLKKTGILFNLIAQFISSDPKQHNQSGSLELQQCLLQVLLIIIMLAKIKAAIKTHKNKILAAISFVAAGYFIYRYFDEDESIVKISTFLQAVKSNKVDNIMIDGERIFFKSRNSDWYQTIVGSFPITNIFSLISEKKISFYNNQDLISSEVIAIGVTCLTSIGAFKYMIKQLNKPNISPVQYKSNIYGGGSSFDDYYGGEEIKEKFQEIIDFLHNSEKYQQMGARIRRGVLFYGPPGTGKTLLARALANQAGCSFIKVVASEFQQIFVGVGPKRIRQLFQSARKCPNGCIIFIDQIDALGSRLNHLRDSHETTTTINQFLSEMDGFYPNQKVLIVGATNRIDLVDHAILRAGRFDLKIYIPLPDIEQRKGILKKILSKKIGELNNVDQNTIEDIVKRSESWCGADIETLVNESIYKAIQQNREFVSSTDILSAFDEIVQKK